MSKVAVVTGASSGIGAATAETLAGRGWRVVLVARSKDKLEAHAERLASSGGAAVVEAVDAADGDAVLAMAERVQSSLGVPDLVVNAAGLGAWKYIEEMPPAEAAECLGAPFQAAYNTTHAFMRGMLERDRGVFVHVGSPASIQPWPGSVAYAAARWALRGLNEALHVDLARTGVASCHVMFGKVTDSAYFDVNEGAADRLPVIERYLPSITSAECADVIVRLADKPRRELAHPWLFRLMAWQAQHLPGVYRRLNIATGHKR